MPHPVIELDLECYKALEARRISLDESLLDILRRTLAPTTGNEDAAQPGLATNRPIPSSLPSDWLDKEDTVSRRTGHYRVQMGERCHYAASQKSAYRLGLLWLSKLRPDLLDILSKDGTSRRRIVARSPGELYPRSPGLAKHAEKLTDGWYVDVNLSREQKRARLKTASRLAGLEFDKDLIVEL